MGIENFWQLFAGLGIFLFGMFQMEEALKKIAGRTFKLFLRKHTDNTISAVFSGIIATGVLQSSSVVAMIALNFVGTGVISMTNALAVVFGSNLGATLDGWIFANIGFKFNIETFIFPIIALSGIGLILFLKKKKTHQILEFCMGFGFLFLGLVFIRKSTDAMVLNFDFTPYIHFSKLTYVIIGFIITSLVQSGSATMVITLSALNAKAIPFDTAVVIIIGSELGTFVKLFVLSIDGVIVKKRVAYGNFIFNIVITTFAYVFTSPIIFFIRKVFGINDPLFGLVMFQTIINFAGIVLLFPFLKKLSGFLEKYIKDKTLKNTYFIQGIDSYASEVVIEAFEKETLLFIHRAIRLNLEAFRIEIKNFRYDKYIRDALSKIEKLNESYSEKYDNIKQTEGEILLLYAKINKEKIEENDFIRLNQLVSSVKNAMYSVKSIKDIREDRVGLRESANDEMYEHYQFLQSQLHHFYSHLKDFFLQTKQKKIHFDGLVKLMTQTQKDYNTSIKKIYGKSTDDVLNEIDLSTLLNMSREIYSSNKAMIFSLKDYVLDTTLSENFDTIPSTVK